MAYTNSPLTKYTKLSPNHSGQRTHSIDRISPHCVVGQCTAEGLGDWFSSSSAKASSNYGIDKNGRIGMYVEEKNRSWCTSSNENDQRAVTIECASEQNEPYKMNDEVYTSLINLCIDICRRNGKTKLLWFGDKNKTLEYQPKENEMVLTVHRWFANKSCPGDWLYSRLGNLANEVTTALSSNKPAASKNGLKASELKNMSEQSIISKVGPLFTADQRTSGILASVSLAQFILESGYGKSELAQNANNCFGMKCSLSGNNWSNSAWNGKDKYTKSTKEFVNGKYITIEADFRKYPSIEKSIADHSAYLLGAKNGSELRYNGLKGCKDYKKAITIIKEGGYATSPTYVENICNIIEKWNLTKYDVVNTGNKEETAEAVYRVRKTWTDTKSQIGAYKVLTNAKKKVDENPGYYVFDENGKAVYPKKKSSSKKVVPAQSNDKSLAGNYRVIARDGLNLRYEPGKLDNEYVIRVIPVNAVVHNYGYYTEVNGAEWLYVDYRGQVGFVRSSYLRKI